MYIIRISGTSDFVSKIDPDYDRCWPPGRVELVKGWDNPGMLRFDTLEEAEAASKQVFEIEGFHNVVEKQHQCEV